MALSSNNYYYLLSCVLNVSPRKASDEKQRDKFPFCSCCANQCFLVQANSGGGWPQAICFSVCRRIQSSSTWLLLHINENTGHIRTKTFWPNDYIHTNTHRWQSCAILTNYHVPNGMLKWIQKCDGWNCKWMDTSSVHRTKIISFSIQFFLCRLSPRKLVYYSFLGPVRQFLEQTF